MTSNSNPINKSIIRLEREEEVNFWKETFGVEESILRNAIDQVGSSTKEVSAYLCQLRIQNEKSSKIDHG